MQRKSGRKLACEHVSDVFHTSIFFPGKQRKRFERRCRRQVQVRMKKDVLHFKETTLIHKMKT